MNNKKILDIENLQSEFEKIKKREEILNNRFIALGLDYNFYFSKNHKDDRFFKIRNDIFYRLYGSLFHVELLLMHFQTMQNYLEHLWQVAVKEQWKEPFLQSMQVNGFIYSSTQQVSSLFDSIIYHISTIFDYLGSIINYIFNLTGSKDQPMKWTSLTQATRDKNKEIYTSAVANKIREVDNDFVEPLYRHRSKLIHNQSDVCNITITVSQEKDMEVKFMSTPTLCKTFHQLRKIYEENSPTMRYVVFWILNRSYDIIRDILLSLKSDMEKLGSHPSMRKGSENALIFGLVNDKGLFVPPSEGYWQEKDPL